MTTQPTQKNYFNLHTTGLGYLNNIRLVEPKPGKKGTPFYSCNISALVGEASNPEYRFFNCNVVGEETENLIKRCQDAVSAEKKVLISFVMSDLWYDTFTYQKDSKYHKKDEVGIASKGRLIRINMVKVDGEIKYQAPQKSAETNPESAE